MHKIERNYEVTFKNITKILDFSSDSFEKLKDEIYKLFQINAKESLIVLHQNLLFQILNVFLNRILLHFWYK